MKGGVGKRAKRNQWCFLLGLFAVACMAVPYFVLGTDSIVVYHDQLDGEMIAYLLQAKHLFDGGILPEFLGGASKTALIPPAPMCVLLFWTGNPFAAYVVMQTAGSLTGFLGMYLLVKKVTDKAWIGAGMGVLFAYLPFLPVYGLSQYGIPLLLWCFLEMKEGKHGLLGIGYSVFYALNSSLVLVGFGVLGMLAAGLVWDVIQRKKFVLPFAAWGGMLLVYVLENVPLLGQTLGIGTQEVSHKAEYVLYPESFAEGWKTAIWEGGQHSGDFHQYLFVVMLLVSLVFVGSCLIRRKDSGREAVMRSHAGRLFQGMGILFGWLVCFALISAFWGSQAGITVRSEWSALGAFQLNRLLWISPALWYLLFGCGVALLAEMLEASRGLRRGVLYGMVLLTAGAVGVTGIRVLLASNIKPNLQKLLHPDYHAISYGDYYALGVMEQVESYIREETAMEQDGYRVASLGIDPAAALYGGFYCVDGYSNNYSLEYKHRFRQVIAPELDKSDYLKDWFDNWGNRCYLVSAESPGYYTIEKGGFCFYHLAIDTESLKDMGCTYILSAAYILNGEEIGLKLLREEPFETEDSYYKIYLYEL